MNAIESPPPDIAPRDRGRRWLPIIAGTALLFGGLVVSVSGVVESMCLGLLLVCPDQPIDQSPATLWTGLGIAALTPIALAGFSRRRAWLLAGLGALGAGAGAYVLTVLVAGRLLTPFANVGVGLIGALAVAGLVGLPAPKGSAAGRAMVFSVLTVLSLAAADEDHILAWVALFFLSLPGIALADALAERGSR